jgi:arylsulfatase A-like enzyme
MPPPNSSPVVRALVLGWLGSTLLFALAEALEVPLRVYANRPELFPGVVAHATAFQLRYLPMALLLQTFVLVRVLAWPSLSLGRAFAWQAVPAALTSAEMLWILSDNPGFLSHLPPVFLILSLAPVLALGYAVLGWNPDSPRRAFKLLSSPVLGVTCLLGAVALFVINNHAFPDKYPSYHVALSQLSLVLLQLGLTHLALALRAERASQRWVAVLCGAVLGFSVPGLLGRAPEAHAFFSYHTLFGLGETMFQAYQPWREDVHARPLPEVSEPAAEFRLRTHLPALPEAFRLDDYNVLLVVAESTRHDQTSLPGAGQVDTPSLAALAAADGTQIFTEAYSPSSATLQSMSSVMSMTYPSAARVKSWHRRFNGELSARTDTVAELFAREGRATFWIGHNLKCIFDDRLLGLKQGFVEVDLPVCHEQVADSDAWIAEHTVKRLRTLAAAPAQRFFGWVFLSAPHGPYHVEHEDERLTRFERYRLAIQYMDKRLGMILDELRTTGLWDRTVVVFMGDHGEEFHEHGGEYHATAVFRESVHVPLLVHVPGLPRAVHALPVSTAHALPWLMLHGRGAMRSAVEARLRREVVPMLRATDGAVVTELLGQDRMQTALRTPGRSVHYDLIADLPRVYADPGELNDLYELDPAALSTDLARIAGYRTVRASTRRFELDPERYVALPAD